MFRSARCLAALALLVAFTGITFADTRYDQYIKKYNTPKQPAKPIAAGYLGGSGDEYLAGGAFLPEGQVLLAGTAYGPSFSLKNVQVSVIGRDAAAPSFKMPTRTKKGRTRLNPPDWSYTQGAGFIVQLDRSAKKIEKAVRFPWGAASLTDIATDEKGGIYVTGITGDNFNQLTRATPARTGDVGGDDTIFVGKLKADLSGFDWAHTLGDDKDFAPKLKLLDNGRIALLALNAHHLDASGKFLKSTAVAKTNNWSRGVDPVTHASASGGDSNTGTGYEPWRQPVLFIFNDKGEHTDEFYRWSSRLVGLNWSRLVSDSDVRLLNYDKNGHLLVGGWSDGGNTVFEKVPYDMKTGVNAAVRARTGRNTGLGFSTWGAGVGSFLHIIKIDTETGEPLAKTLFAAYLGDKNRPNGLGANMLDTAADNSILLGGGSAWGLIETRSLVLNTLDRTNDYMGGPFIAILTELMDDIRFCSAIPGGGKVDLARHNRGRSANWGSSSKKVGPKTRVLFVCGAVKDEKFKAHNAAQKEFGGGDLDGLYVVLEMDTLPQAAYRPGTVAETDDEAEKKSKKKKKNKAKPLQGKYRIAEGMDRHWTILVLRDQTGKKWPAFYFGHPKGSSEVDASGSGTFTLFGPGEDVELIDGSRQEKRLGGHTFRKEEYTDKKGRERTRHRFADLEATITLTSATTAKAVVKFDGKSVNLTGSAYIRPSKPTGKGINIGGKFQTTKAALGLNENAADANDPITIEYWTPARP